MNSHIVQQIYKERENDDQDSYKDLDQQPCHSEQKEDTSDETTSQTRVSVITIEETSENTFVVWRFILYSI